MKLWTGKFVLALVVFVLFILDAKWYPLDPFTQKPLHLLPHMDTWAASFVCLLSLLFVITHGGSWVLAKFRAQDEQAQVASRRRRRR